MARPVQRRRSQQITREIELIGRLRTALLLDPQLDVKKARLAVEQIDTLLNTLAELANSMAQDEQKTA